MSSQYLYTNTLYHIRLIEQLPWKGPGLLYYQGAYISYDLVYSCHGKCIFPSPLIFICIHIMYILGNNILIYKNSGACICISLSVLVWNLHVQIPPTRYVCVAYYAIPLFLWGYSDAFVLEATVHVVAAEYPHSTLNGTATCSSHSCTVLYETHVCGQGNLDVYFHVKWEFL